MRAATGIALATSAPAPSTPARCRNWRRESSAATSPRISLSSIPLRRTYQEPAHRIPGSGYCPRPVSGWQRDSQGSRSRSALLCAPPPGAGRRSPYRAALRALGRDEPVQLHAPGRRHRHRLPGSRRGSLLRRVRQDPAERHRPRDPRLPRQRARARRRRRRTSASTSRPTTGPARSSRASPPSSGTGTASTSSTRRSASAGSTSRTSASSGSRPPRRLRRRCRPSSPPTSTREAAAPTSIGDIPADPACAARVDTPEEQAQIYAGGRRRRCPGEARRRAGRAGQRQRPPASRPRDKAKCKCKAKAQRPSAASLPRSTSAAARKPKRRRSRRAPRPSARARSRSR